MVKSGWSCVLLGVMVTAVVACSKPAIEEDHESSPADEPSIHLLATENAAQSPIPTAGQPTIPPPPIPTAAPTTSLYSTWQQAGSQGTGLQLLAPPEWINLSARLDMPTTTNELGLIVLLLADSERTGASLLSSKPLAAGAYVAGLVSYHNLPPNTPQATLAQLLNQLNKDASLLHEPMSITAFTSAGGRITGAFADVVGEPLIFGNGQSDLRTRIFLFTTTLAGAASQNTQAIFLMSAPETAWAEMETVLEQMTKTFVIHNIQANYAIRGGAANVLGELAASDMVSGQLATGVKDVWTFQVTGEQYASLTLSPQLATLDLTMTLISPSGQTIAQVDNGYADEIETAVDLRLLETGPYVVEVGEFFNQPGGYTLSLVLSAQPLFGGGGAVGIGQTIQGNLPPDGQHVWRFTAEAGATVSVVLNPVNFDVVLNVYAPDGRSLIELDEGFSGDAEIVSGLVLPTGGEYTILVRSFAGGSGSYSLTLTEGGDNIASFYDAGDLAYGDTKPETLQENEAHAWFFNGHAGDQIMAEVTPLDNNLDLDVWLLDPNLARLTAVDSTLAGQPEYLVFTLPQDGQFLLLVRDFFGEPGRYEINLTAVPASAPLIVGTLRYGVPVQGGLVTGQSALWQFDGRLGDTVSIVLQPDSSQTDLRLSLVDVSGARILEVDQAGAGQPEQIASFTLTADGIWGVLVEEFFGEAVGYSLVITEQ